MRVLERLSPDVAAIVQEIAQQPNSLLLTATPQMARRELMTPPDRVGSAAPFLSSAERELVGLYREEVANACYGAAALSLKAWAKQGHFDFAMRNGRGEDVTPGTIAGILESRQRFLDEELDNSIIVARGRRLVLESVPEDRRANNEITELLTIAQRLRPHCLAAIQGSAVLALDRQLPSSRLMASAAISSVPQPAFRGFAHTNLGFAEHRSRMWVNAYESYWTAAQLMASSQYAIDAAINAYLGEMNAEFKAAARTALDLGLSSPVDVLSHLGPDLLVDIHHEHSCHTRIGRALSELGIEVTSC